MLTARQALDIDEDGLLRLAGRFPIRSYLDVFGVGRLLADPNVCLVAAQADDLVLGYLLAYDRNAHPRFAGVHAAEIEEIMVSEDYRNRGVGRLLVERFEAWARARQCSLIQVGGAPARDFYHAVGYHDAGFRLQKILDPCASPASPSHHPPGWQ